MPQPWEQYQAQGQQGPWTQFQTPAQTPAQAPVQTPQDARGRAREALGLKDYEYRGTILPFGRTREGEVELALPQVAVDVATSAMLPGYAMQGAPYSPQDVTRAAMDIAVPATAGRGVGAGVRRPLRDAPSTEELKQAAVGMKEAAVGSGVVVKPDAYVDMMADLESSLLKQKLDPTLHPDAHRVFNLLSEDIGKPLDVEDLMIARRLIGVPQRTVAPELADQRRIAQLMEERLDDFVDNLQPKDLAEGDPLRVSGNLAQFRKLWSQAKKSEAIEQVISRAELAASGFENGLRTEFRALLKNPKRLRGFTADEKKIMRQIVEGTGGQKALRLLGKLSFGTRGGTNFLGGTIGMAAGSQVGGPVGALIPPAIGYLSQKGADAAARAAAQRVRGLAATGGQTPRGRVLDRLIQAAPPVAGTQIPYDPGVI